MGKEYRVGSAEQRGCVRLQGQESSKYLRHMNQTRVTRAWVCIRDEVCRVTGWIVEDVRQSKDRPAENTTFPVCRLQRKECENSLSKAHWEANRKPDWEEEMVSLPFFQFSQLKIISLALCTIIQIVYRKSEQIERLTVHQHHFLLPFLNKCHRISLKRFRSFRRKYWG